MSVYIFFFSPDSFTICLYLPSIRIYYVTRTATISAETNIQVVGDYSSKITYIVRLILQLQQDHSKDVQPLKILIFSQWTEILHPIAMALTQNVIRHRLNLTPRTIEEFKVVCIYLLIDCNKTLNFRQYFL